MSNATGAWFIAKQVEQTANAVCEGYENDKGDVPLDEVPRALHKQAHKIWLMARACTEMAPDGRIFITVDDFFALCKEWPPLKGAKR